MGEALAGRISAGRWLAGLIAVAAGLAVIIQVILAVAAIMAMGRTWLDGLVTVLGFFTVLTNIIVAVVAGACALRGEAGTFLTRPSTRAAVMVYILVVGIIFALLLANLRPMSGLKLIVDDVLHRVTPVLFVLYWLFFVPKGTLRRRDPLLWMIYPALYVAYSLVYGAATGRYMYPFANANVLGYPRALANAAFILVFFFVLGLIVVAADHALAGGRNQAGGPPPP
jgi:hypothetical protein